MIEFKREWMNKMYTEKAIYDGKTVAQYRVTDSAIDDGVVEMLVEEIPLATALWAVNRGRTNHGWFEVNNGYLYIIDVDRYTSELRKNRVAKVKV